jgi:carbon monoxide dehydrogenase subunit G
MDMTGEHRIAAPRDKVWAGLNDPEVLKASIPGCQTLDRTENGGFAATVVTKVGPVKATFKGDVTLSNINAPESYTISGEGKGGAAGFAKGGADVKLVEDGPDATILTYSAKADVGGKLAQLGSRLIDGTARKLAGEFFTNFSGQMAPAIEVPVEPPVAPVEAPADQPVAPAPATRVPVPLAPGGFAASSGLAEMMQSKLIWASLVIVILMILTLLLRGA